MMNKAIAMILAGLFMYVATTPLYAASPKSWLSLDADETSETSVWNGGSGTLQVWGSFTDNPTVALQWTSHDDAPFLSVGTSCELVAADSFCNFSIGNGVLQLVITGGTGSDIVSARVGQPNQASTGLSSGAQIPASDQGEVQFADGGFLTGSDFLFVDEISSQLGIGTTNPITALHLDDQAGMLIGPAPTLLSSAYALQINRPVGGGVIEIRTQSPSGNNSLAGNINIRALDDSSGEDIIVQIAGRVDTTDPVHPSGKWVFQTASTGTGLAIRMTLDDSGLEFSPDGPLIANTQSTSTVPTLMPDANDTNTGIGRDQTTGGVVIVDEGTLTSTFTSTTVIIAPGLLFGLPTDSTPPATCTGARFGMMYADTNQSVPCFCDGSDWIQVTDSAMNCT